jgi:magnesium transporter
VYADGQVQRDGRAGAVDFTWVRMCRPPRSQMAAVAAEFGLDDFVVDDACSAHQRPRLTSHDCAVQVVLKPVHYVDREEVVEVTELVLFLGEKFLITVEDGDNDILDLAQRALEPWPGDALTPTDVLVRVVRMTIDGYEDAIEGLRNDVDEIEEAVFGPMQGDYSERIYKLKREVAEFRRAVNPLGRVLDRLANQDLGLEAAADPHFAAAHQHLLQVGDAIDAIDRLLSDVLQANVARVANVQSEIALRQNEDMRKISAWAAIALVPTGVAGIYGMNFEHMPELEWRFGYPMAISVIVLICLWLYITFRRNDWL